MTDPSLKTGLLVQVPVVVHILILGGQNEDNVHTHFISGKNLDFVAEVFYSRPDPVVDVLLHSASEYHYFCSDNLIPLLLLVENVSLSVEILAPEVNHFDT